MRPCHRCRDARPICCARIRSVSTSIAAWSPSSPPWTSRPTWRGIAGPAPSPGRPARCSPRLACAAEVAGAEVRPTGQLDQGVRGGSRQHHPATCCTPAHALCAHRSTALHECAAPFVFIRYNRWRGTGSGIQTMGLDTREAPSANRTSELRISMHCSIVSAAADDWVYAWTKAAHSLAASDGSWLPVLSALQYFGESPSRLGVTTRTVH